MGVEEGVALEVAVRSLMALTCLTWGLQPLPTVPRQS